MSMLRIDRSSQMRAFALVAWSAVLLATTARAQVPSFPANFKTRKISTRGAQIFVRVGGQGPAVVLLHGYGETGGTLAPRPPPAAARPPHPPPPSRPAERDTAPPPTPTPITTPHIS